MRGRRGEERRGEERRGEEKRGEGKIGEERRGAYRILLKEPEGYRTLVKPTREKGR